MKRLFRSVLASLGLGSDNRTSAVLAPNQFAAEFTDALRKASPGLKAEIIGELELKVTTPDGGEMTSFLNNAYDMYRQDPEHKDEVIAKFVEAGLETFGGINESAGIDRTRIVPVIKDRAWLEETRQALIDRGAKELPGNVYEDFNSDLVILYAEDSPKNVRYFGPDDLEKAGVAREELRGLACENLKRLLPKIERHGTNGLFMMTAGGDYEASLLAIDSIWNDLQKEVRGDIVAAIPTRDLLIFTGSEDRRAIDMLKQMVRKAFSEGSYRLTQKLFVYREGEFIEFEDRFQ